MRKEDDIIRDIPDHDDPNAPLTALVAILFAVLTVAIVVALQGYFEYAQHAEYRIKVVDAVPEQLQKVREDGQAQLNGYRWIDPEAGVVAIPIERAMELTVDRAGD
jgi:hypothetical protein